MGRFLRGSNEGAQARLRGGGEEIAATVETKHVVALRGQLLEEIDAPVHEGDHVIAGTRPPVAIALGGLVAGEGQRWPLVDDHDAAQSPTHGQVIGGGDARDAGAADHDLRRGLRHIGGQHTSPRCSTLSRRCDRLAGKCGGQSSSGPGVRGDPRRLPGPRRRFVALESRSLPRRHGPLPLRLLAYAGRSAVAERSREQAGFVLDAAKSQGLTVDRGGLPEGVRKLRDLAAAVPERDTKRGGARDSFLARLGKSALSGLAGARAMVTFVGESTVALAHAAVGRARFRRVDLMLNIQEAGENALGIVSLISFLIGLILAFVGAVQLRQFGAQIYIADLVAIGMAREMGAMMAAIIMAGRTGAAYAAQLGTMRVNEEIDALSTMGISPFEFLVLPRMLGLILMMPLLTIYANLVGILGGAVVGVGMLKVGLIPYWNHTLNAATLGDFAAGLIKSAVFGVLIAIAGCMRGMQSGRSSAAVGLAATSAVVTGIVFIIVSDAILTVVYDAIGF